MTRSNSLSWHKIFLTDVEVITAALMAYQQNEGKLKTVTTSDVYIMLGIDRNSREWDDRTAIVSNQRMTFLMRKAGFIPVENRAKHPKVSRYTLGVRQG